jgi:DNA polymerase-3 subunit gamma/tau
MSYLVLARKWRPQKFEDLVGQGHVAKTLQNAIASGRIGHGYLFTGPRGVGKTSTARILAKALNCAKGPTPTPCGECPSCLEVAGPGSVDVLEIDGASNNSVEDVRNLREKVAYGGVRDRYKIYIIDEVHMLSGAAFNALLKTLEEPPSHVIFIFATTEVQKIPATILSRTQRFDFRRIATADLAAQLKKILEAERIPGAADALHLVARAAGGSMRDGQTLLDQVISFCGQGQAITASDVLQVLGGVDEAQVVAALKAGLSGDAGGALEWVRQLYERGADLRVALASLTECLRALLLLKSGAQAAGASDLLPETLASLAEIHGAGLARLFTVLKSANEAEAQMRYTSNQRLVLESLLLRLSPKSGGQSLGELFDQLSAMEERLKGAPQSAPPSPVSIKPNPSTPPPPPVGPSTGLGPAVLEKKTPVEPVRPAETPPPPPVKEAGTPVAVIEEIEEAKPAGAWNLEAVKGVWEQVVEKATAQSYMLGTSLRDVNFGPVEAKILHLVAVNGMQRDTLESSEHRGQLEAILTQVFGRPLSVKVSFLPPKPAAKAKVANGLTPEELEKALTPEVRRIQEMFDAEIVEIKKI